MKHKSLEKLIPLVTLPLTLAVCLTLWMIMSNNTYTEVYGKNGVWDLRGFDFENESARVVGDVEYIPNALLTPEEFAARTDEIQVGRPEDVCQYATSRIRILLPDGFTYMLAGRSTDFSSRMYINGKWIVDVGSPGDSRETTIPNTADLTFMGEPENGVLEIVQQVSNFVHREGGNHSDFRIGYPDVVRATYRHDVTAIIMGCFLALFLVHLTLYFILRVYKANLYFSLFCLMWFLRTGVTGVKVFSSLLPWLSWYAKFRIEYVTLPLTGILVILMLHELFPGILTGWFRRAVYVVSGVFIALFLFTDTVFMSWAMFGCYAYQAVSILIVALCFLRRFRRPDSTQMVSLAGTAIFLYAGLRDMFYYSDILLPPFVNADLSQISMLIFVFFQMTAMFMGTVHAAEEARAMEQKLTADNAALDRLHRMKSDLLATVAHETRTPLAVLSGYAELISMEMKRKGVDLQTAKDLDRIADEIQRIAAIMEEMQNFSREKENAGHRDWIQTADIIRQSARLYAPILERKKTSIVVNLPDEPPPVFANAGELTQVMFNLLQNARNHTESGTVTLSARDESGMVAVSVSDTGQGIPAELLSDVFKRGVSGDENAGSPGGSTGLGLAICKEIIDAHGGAITIDSEPGRGTTVTFTIPITPEGGVHDGAENGFIG